MLGIPALVPLRLAELGLKGLVAILGLGLVTAGNAGVEDACSIKLFGDPNRFHGGWGERGWGGCGVGLVDRLGRWCDGYFAQRFLR